MAGYRKSGANDFVNATSFNEQIKRQREAYKGGSISEMGVYTSQSVFPDRSQEVLEASTDTMKELDLRSELGNPDFVPHLDFTHSGSESMFDDLQNAKDQPNKKGPNLISPDINNISAPTENQATIPEDRQNKGFGWRDDRNEPSSPASTIGTYFSRHYNSSGDDTSVSLPILGEAKSPSEDPNIDYKQP